MAFIPVRDVEAARRFYETVLGLPVVDASPFALVVDANGTKVRITPVPELHPQPFTIAGWQVDDLDAAVSTLSARGVRFEHYDGMEQSDSGIWSSPSGDRVAWFDDPDGNILSLTQFAKA
jgi:catechol 2,3-dioxygenase-like lactoylglutathione lyase family enzyme